MIKPLEFKNFAINDRKYYTADFNLGKKDYNLNHCHDFYEFVVVRQGEFQEIVNGETIVLPISSAHFLRPADCHYFIGADQYNINSLRNIAIEKAYFEAFQKELGYTDTDLLFQPFQLDETAFVSYNSKINLLLQLGNSEEINLFLIKSILSDMWIHALLNKTGRKDIPQWLQNAYQQIGREDNYKKQLAYFIELSGKSQEHFTRTFKKYYGITPSDHMNNLRLQEAASLLRTSGEKIIDIVYECGFENVSYFNRLFKAKFGVRPREYRDNNKNIFNISI